MDHTASNFTNKVKSYALNNISFYREFSIFNNRNSVKGGEILDITYNDIVPLMKKTKSPDSFLCRRLHLHYLTSKDHDWNVFEFSKWIALDLLLG